MINTKRIMDRRGKQMLVLKAIEEYINSHGYPPSIRDICDAINISSTSHVKYLLMKLEEDNYIERDTRIPRGIRLV